MSLNDTTEHFFCHKAGIARLWGLFRKVGEGGTFCSMIFQLTFSSLPTSTFIHLNGGQINVLAVPVNVMKDMFQFLMF